MNIRPHGKPRMVPRKQAVALCKKIFKRSAANLRQPPRRAQPPVARVEDRRMSNKPPSAIERKLAFGPLVQPHLRPIAGQAENESHCRRSQQAADIHREVVDARRIGVLVMNVSAKVQFGKTPRSGNGGNPAEVEAIHPQRHNTDPRRALKGIRLQPLGQEGRHGRCGHPPMRKKQVVPALRQYPASGWQWPGPLRCPQFELPHSALCSRS